MKLTICCIQDKKAQAWMNPLFFQSAEQGIRSFGDAVNSEGDFAKHPEDYVLYKLGEFDQRTGELRCEAPEALVLGSNLLRVEQ